MCIRDRDAMIVEYGSDTKVRLIEGSYENLKVTTPEDMGIAELFCSLLHICFKAKESAGGGIRKMCIRDSITLSPF